MNQALNREERFNKHINSLSKWNSLVYKSSSFNKDKFRTYFGNKYIKGYGIEIGAQANPLAITNAKARVKYGDIMSPEQNHELHKIPIDLLVRVDIYAEAADLNCIKSGSIDFVIANHLFEHMEDPISAFLEWYRVIKRKGIIFMTVPNDKCNEYDFEREPHSINHIVADYEDPGFNQ